MGGYNTLNEALSLGKPVLAFPRDAVSEQALQVDGLVARGLIMSGGRSMDIGTIARNMLRLLDFKPAFIPDFAGAARSAACIQDLLESAESAERHHLQEDHVPSG
jgi:predicted glycosyltransferase